MQDQQQQQDKDQPNRYAHLISQQQANQCEPQEPIRGQIQISRNNAQQQASEGYIPQMNPPIVQNFNHNQTQAVGNPMQMPTRNKPPPLGTMNGNQYYNSFSRADLKEQWSIMKSKILEKVDEPSNQRKLIMIIVCCALLLDNMLYMVIVPIIPDYLRNIGAWQTYAKENAKWVMRSNHTGGPKKWERVSGDLVYEGEDSAVGFLFASKAIVQLFINPFSGAIIDRIGYEIPMMIGLIVMFFSTMVFAIGQTYTVLFMARSLQGVGSAFADTAGLAMIADRFTDESERSRALGVALAFISFGCLVAPPFGSILYQAAGKEVPFIILSLICLIDGSLLLLVTPPGTFAQILPGYRGPPVAHASDGDANTTTTTTTDRVHSQRELEGSSSSGSSATSPTTYQEREYENQRSPNPELEGTPPSSSNSRQSQLKRQKSISRRQSLTVASRGETPKGTPIYILFRDPCIACCAGALVMANVSLAFLEPTISIWVENTMPEIEEWQLGIIWLPAFFPHIAGVYTTVKLADKYPRYQWLIAAIGLVLEGLSCLMVPFCTSFWSLIIPISIICFGVAQIDTAILPTLGYLVDTRYVSVYGSIYAIADISYSLSYAIGPIIAGGIVEAIGFTALNILIAIVTLGYTPCLMMLRPIHDYEPFDADASGQRRLEDAPFGQFGRKPVDLDLDSNSQDNDGKEDNQAAITGQNQAATKQPNWASSHQANLIQQQAGITNNMKQQTISLKSVLTQKGSIKLETRKQHSVKIVEDPEEE